MDLIDRQAALKAIDRAVTKEAARWSVEGLPSAEPEKPFVIKTNIFLKKDERERLEKELCRKMARQNLILLEPGMELVYPRRKGKWLRYGEDGYPNEEDTVFWQCDQCLEQYTGRTTRIPNFCPNCGADMRGEKEDG